MHALLLALALTSAPPVYVALGDSTGVGVGARRSYPARLAARAARAGTPVRLENLCASGARVADVLRDQLGRAVAARPAVVTLGIGINDVLLGTDAASYARDLEEVAHRLDASGARVLLLDVPDLALSPRAVGEEARTAVRGRARTLNAVIADVARRHAFERADLFGRGDAVYGAPGTLSGDAFHPSDLGYERWADALAAPFQRLLSRAASGGAGLSPGAPVR